MTASRAFVGVLLFSRCPCVCALQSLCSVVGASWLELEAPAANAAGGKLDAFYKTVMAFTLVAMDSNLLAMAPTVVAMASNLQYMKPSNM